MRILFKLATRSRPHKFFKCLDNIMSLVTDKFNYDILVSCDEDDESMARDKINGALLKRLSEGNIIVARGTSKNKVEAINRDIDWMSHWDILVNTSDDMLFTQKGFDDVIRRDMEENFPDTDGVLHYNDGNQKSNVMTMSIMGRNYYERFGYIYHPAYKSVWCDVEQTEVAYMLNRHQYMGDEKILFRHLHPAWGLAEYDAQYRASENLDVWGEDLNIFLERRRRNFDLNQEQIINPYKYSSSEVLRWQNELNATRAHKGFEKIQF
jgi:hypothetical protein